MTEIIYFNAISKRLSQFSMTYHKPFVFKNIEYPTLRHLAYATKCTMLDTLKVDGLARGAHSVIAEMSLRELSTSDDIKLTNKNYHKEVLSNIRQAIMLRIEEDNTQDFLHDLLSTDNAVLLYSAPYDPYWGYGNKNEGANRLGLLLEDIREELRNKK